MPENHAILATMGRVRLFGPFSPWCQQPQLDSSQSSQRSQPQPSDSICSLPAPAAPRFRYDHQRWAAGPIADCALRSALIRPLLLPLIRSPATVNDSPDHAAST